MGTEWITWTHCGELLTVLSPGLTWTFVICVICVIMSVLLLGKSLKYFCHQLGVKTRLTCCLCVCECLSHLLYLCLWILVSPVIFVIVNARLMSRVTVVLAHRLCFKSSFTVQVSVHCEGPRKEQTHECFKCFNKFCKVCHLSVSRTR